jgi:hypothetical protein
MLLSVTHQQANQIAAALRIFQALRQTGEGFREVDGQHVTIAEMEHFEETEPLADEEIEQMIDKAYEGANTKPRVGLWHNRPDFDDEGELNGHTLIVDNDDNPVLVTCAGTKAVDLAKATAAPALLNALKALVKVVDEVSNRSGWPDNAPRYAAKTAIEMAEGEAA